MSRPSMSPGFDQRIADWLEEDPDHAPDAVLETVLAAFPSITQRRTSRVPWRTTRMTLPARLAAAAIALAIVVAGGVLVLRPGGGPSVGGQSPGAASPSPSAASPSVAATSPSAAATSPSAAPTILPSPTPRATLAPLTAEFVSPWYGYRVRHPAGWRTTPGDGPWPVGQELQHNNPHLDEIQGQIGQHQARFVGASVLLPKGMTIDGFRAFASPPGPYTCQPVEPLPTPLRVDGVDAQVTLQGCLSDSELGGWIWDIVLVDAGRGYDFTIDGYLTSDEALAFLESVTLEPGTARKAGG